MQNTLYKLYDKTLLDMSETQNDWIARETRGESKNLAHRSVWLFAAVFSRALEAAHEMNRPEITDYVQQTAPEDVMSPMNAI